MSNDPKGGAGGGRKLAGLSGAKLFCEMLQAEGVDVLFGYPGGMVLPVFDALLDSPIRYIQSRHEQGAAHMADAYSRASGKVGTVIATSGPGATNLVTGLATAYMDSAPMVAFTGQVKSFLIGNDAFQEADMTGITRPITKHNYLVKRVEDLGRVIREAYHIAATGRPGPVLVDIAVDATTSKLDGEPNLEMDLPGYKPRAVGHVRQIMAAAEAINEAERPVLYVGGGVIIAGASAELRALAEKGNLPVTTTLLALGAFDESHPLAMNMLGMHGSATANYAVQDSDCLVAIGARFDDRVTGDLRTFCPKAKIIHIDIDPASISKNVQVHVPVVGDAKDILERMLPHIQSKPRTEWLARIAEWKAKHPFRYEKSPTTIKPQQVIEALGELTDHDAVVATGVGQHQMWAAQFYGWRWPRQIITSGGLGTMGYGCPAAIGAQVACPGKTVLDIDGDGSFTMTMVEVITAVRYDLPVKWIVLDNDYLGMVRQWQEMFYQHRYSGVHHPCPDFKQVAEGFGAKGIRPADPSELHDCLREALKHEGPVVVHVPVEKEENVFPMVPAGKSLHEMTFGNLA